MRDKREENLVNHAKNLFLLQDTVGDLGYFCFPKTDVLRAECLELAGLPLEQDLKVKISSNLPPVATRKEGVEGVTSKEQLLLLIAPNAAAERILL